MKVFRAVLRLSVLVPIAFSAYAQTPTGTILGRVQDSSAAMIPAAKIRVREVSTNLERTVLTNELGYYEIPLLPAKYGADSGVAGAAALCLPNGTS